MGARFATSFAFAFVMLGALSACKPTQDSAVKNDGPVEAAPAPTAIGKEVLARFTMGEERVLMLTRVSEGRPIVQVRFRRDAQGETANNIDLHLVKDANGNQRCESTGAGFACRYQNELAQTDMTFRYDRATDKMTVGSVTWQGKAVADASIASRNPAPGEAEIGCDLMTGVGCGF